MWFIYFQKLTALCTLSSLFTHAFTAHQSFYHQWISNKTICSSRTLTMSFSGTNIKIISRHSNTLSYDSFSIKKCRKSCDYFSVFRKLHLSSCYKHASLKEEQHGFNNSEFFFILYWISLFNFLYFEHMQHSKCLSSFSDTMSLCLLPYL